MFGLFKAKLTPKQAAYAYVEMCVKHTDATFTGWLQRFMQSLADFGVSQQVSEEIVNGYKMRNLYFCAMAAPDILAIGNCYDEKTGTALVHAIDRAMTEGFKPSGKDVALITFAFGKRMKEGFARGEAPTDGIAHCLMDMLEFDTRPETQKLRHDPMFKLMLGATLFEYAKGVTGTWQKVSKKAKIVL